MSKLKIEYEIDLNPDGRPYIKLSEDYEDKIEDKFFVIEITRYLLQNVFNKRSSTFDKNTSNKLNEALTILGQVSDEMSEILKGQMEYLGNLFLNMNSTYHLFVKTIEERDNLPTTDIMFNTKIYSREDGLKVLVLDTMKIYKLEGGIENENWKEI